MNLPSILPLEVPQPLKKETLSDVVGHLRLRGQQMLNNKNQNHIIQTLAGIAKCWCLETYSLRKRALELLPQTTGFSREMIEKGLDLTFSKITQEVLRDYVQNELGDFFQPASGVIGHVAPGNLFPPVVQSLFHGLLVKSPNLIRASEQDPHFPVLLAQSLIDADLELADAIAVAHWSSANIGLNREFARQVDTLVVYGSDSTLNDWKSMIPPEKRFVGFGHRLSVGYVSQDGLKKPEETAALCAFDVAMYDQQGCLSPHCFFLEKPSIKQWIDFGDCLSEKLRDLDLSLPVGIPDERLGFVIGNLRQQYLFRASQQPERFKPWFSKNQNWTVLFEADPAFFPSSLGRTIWIRPVSSIEHIGEAVKPWAGKLQCLGTDLSNDHIREYVFLFKSLGFTRICALGSMQAPPITWPNGGMSMLKQLTSG